MRFRSHPERELSDHVQDVYRRVLSMLERIPVEEAERDAWTRLLRLLASCHDFGKYTSFFQKHLAGDRSIGKESYHSLLGALFGSYVREQNRTSTADWKQLEYYLPLIIYFIIVQHHSHLRDFADTVPSKQDYLAVQLQDIRHNVREIELDLSQSFPELAPHLLAFLDYFEEHINRLIGKHNFVPRFFRQLPEYDLSLALMVQVAFSFLIDADKHSAAKNDGVTPNHLSPELVEAYRTRQFAQTVKNEDTLVIKRNLVKRIVTENVSRIDLSKSFHTFTSPTGTGKTLAALEGALLLRDRLSKQGSPPRRIIYVLPFTSIIDQNYAVIQNVITQGKPNSQLVLKHHYMSEIEYGKADGTEELSLDRQLMFIESWESEVIVTTYVQLLHTMLSNQNRQLKKLHNLAGSIVILDEVQNIPFAYWLLTEQLCKAYSEQFDNKWILLTATQPKIFPGSDTVEWLEQPEFPNSRFFADMNRTELRLFSERYLELEEWLEAAYAEAEKVPSALIIVNTIATSTQVYNYFCERMGGDSDEVVYYLSANLIFEHRKRVLKRVRQRLDNGLPVILVSTQVVEAGVDVDFHCVIRDLGPMDSIIQAAGRCNRHGRRPSPEPVVIIPLRKASDKKADSAIVYGQDAYIALETMREFRAEHGDGAIPEKAYQQMVDNYYQKLLYLKENGESRKRLAQLQKLEFDKLSDFSLIPKKNRTIAVYVQYNWKAVWLWNYYVERVCKEKDLNRRRENYLRCKTKLRQFQMDVDCRFVRNRELDYGFVLIRPEWVEADQYYDRRTGWIRDPNDEEAFIW